MRVLVVTKPLAPARPSSSTAEIVRTGLQRGHELFVGHPDGLVLSAGGAVTAIVRPVERCRTTLTDYDDCGAALQLDVADVDLVLMRLQPPVDVGYLLVCELLSHGEERARFVNRPSGLASFVEKLFPIRFPDVHPPTVITAHPETLRKFRREQREVVLKPLNDFQGRGVIIVTADDKNFDALVDLLLDRHGGPIVAQAYIPEVARGDKRVFMIGGRPVGALNRIPASDSRRANLHAGGKPRLARLSARDLEICERVGPELVRLGFNFVGLDIIDGSLTEITVSSPTGLVQLRECGGPSVAVVLWEHLEGMDDHD